jgi:hypothetical protein
VVVDFEQILKLFPSDVGSIQPGAGSTVPFGPITAPEGYRDTLYDPNWGYFIFGQSVEFRYDESDTYIDKAVFTIRGTFTLNAEAAEVDPNLTDEQKLDLMIQAYQRLDAIFEAARNGVEPDDYFDWGTSQDTRCIVLPEPLRDFGGNQIYALPVSLSIDPGQWGNVIKYTAVLSEAKFPTAKATVNGQPIDEGVIDITLPSPILHRSRLVGCYGEAIQCQNYTTMEVSVQGSIGRLENSTDLVPDKMNTLLTSLELGVVDIGVVRLSTEDGGSVSEVLFDNMDLDSDAGLEIGVADLTTAISLRTKAKV